MYSKQYLEFIKKVADTLEKDGNRELALDFLLASTQIFLQKNDGLPEISTKEIEQVKQKILEDAESKIVSQKTNKYFRLHYFLLGCCIFLLFVNLASIGFFFDKSVSENGEVTSKIVDKLIKNIAINNKATEDKIEEFYNTFSSKIDTLASYVEQTEEYKIRSMVQAIGNGEFGMAHSIYKGSSYLNSDTVKNLNKIAEICETHSYDALKNMTPPENIAGNMWEIALHGKLASILKKIGLQPSYDNLAIAVQTKNKDAIELLLEYGLDINSVVNGVTLLSTASRFNDIGSVTLLLTYGADPNIELPDGKRAIDFTTDDQVRELLLEKMK